MSSYHRREFLKTAGVLGAGISVFGLSGCRTASAAKKINQQFGIQLYTLRDVLPSDPKKILTQIASFGYKEIESYEGEQGMYWGMKNTEFKQLMVDLDMKIVASHTDINKDFERKAEEAAAIGMKYLICPWLGPQKSLDDYRKAAATFNQRGETCKKHGIRFAYHNHDYSFKLLEGQYPQDILMQETDNKLVDYEMDIYWVVTAGQDPLTWFNKYPDRFTLAHLKDRKKNVPSSDTDASTVLGTGIIDFSSMLPAAAHKGLNYFIVEQERYDNTTPVEASRLNAEYMKNIKS